MPVALVGSSCRTVFVPVNDVAPESWSYSVYRDALVVGEIRARRNSAGGVSRATLLKSIILDLTAAAAAAPSRRRARVVR